MNDSKTAPRLRQIRTAATDKHPQAVTHAVIDSAGERAYSAALHAGNRTLKAWDAARGSVIWSVRDDAFAALSIAPDRRLAASIDVFGKEIRVWDLDAGRVTGAIACSPQLLSATAIAIHPDGDRVIVQGLRAVSVFSIARGARLHTIDPGDGEFAAAALMGDDRLVTVGQRRGTADLDTPVRRRVRYEVSVWDIGSCARLRTIAETCERFTGITVSGGRAYTTHVGGKLAVWDLERGTVAHPLAQVEIVVPLGGRFAIGDGARTVRVWDEDRGAILRTLKLTLEKAPMMKDMTALWPIPGSPYIVVGHGHPSFPPAVGALSVFNATSGRRVSRWKAKLGDNYSYPTTGHAAPGGGMVIGSSDGFVRLFSFALRAKEAPHG